MQCAEGILRDGNVIIAQEADASRLQNKGHFGVPESGGSLRLHLLEAVYLVEKDRIAVKRQEAPEGPAIDFGELLSIAVKAIPSFEVRYSVYRDLRDRGYILLSPELMSSAEGTAPDWDLEAYSRGNQPVTGNRPDIRVFSVSERAPLVLGELVARVRAASKGDRRVLMALVDEEGDATYYEVSTSEPTGQMAAGPKGSFEGHLLEDRVVVSGKEAHELHASGFYGKPSSGSLQLSFLEAAYLMARGVLSLKNARTGKKVSQREFIKFARARQDEFDERFRAYSDLRDRGMVVKTGFKYGTHFRVYQGDPSNTHARFLMHAVPEEHTSTWPELSRAVRLAHGVRKDILFSRVLSKGMEYVQFRRVRP